LQQKGIIHFDVHLHNILFDEDKFYLSDFGLILDKSFELSKSEKEMFKRHSHYDFGEFVGCIGLELNFKYKKLSSKKKKLVKDLLNVSEDTDWVVRQEVFFSNLGLLYKNKIFDVSRKYFNYLEKNRDAIIFTNRFFFDLGMNPKKDTKY